MACFGPMLGRVSLSVVPLAIRSSGSLRTFHGIAAASSIGGNQRGGGSRRVLKFSTEAKAAKVGGSRGREENVKPRVNIIESEKNVKRAINKIVSEMESKSVKLGMAAPEVLSALKVVDDPNKSYVVFKWEHDDEIIKVVVDRCDINYDKYSMGLMITVTKRGCELQPNFGVTAYSDKLSITRLSLDKKVVEDGYGSEQKKDGTGSDGEEEDEKYVFPWSGDSPYYGPRNWSSCDVVDENFQKDLLYYLEVRGITIFTARFFFNHMDNRRTKSIDKGDMDWLKNLQRFFDY